MRGLIRSVLALFTLGSTIVGCNRSSPTGSAGDDNAPFHASFRVPGMT